MVRNLIRAEIRNCNNVVSAAIQLRKGHLNIRYAMNGTGKSTIATAIYRVSENEDLSELRPFGSSILPACKLSQRVKVLVFNEDFVNDIVFQESEVIQNSFEIFIKTPEYEERKNSIDRRLKNIHVDVANNANLQRIVSIGKAVLSKFSLTNAGDFKRQGLMKSLTSSENIFVLPEKLHKFQPLMQKEYNVEWVGWKNDGAKYDDNGICPFCTSGLSEEYEGEKKVFTSSYSKSNVKNIREMLEYFDGVKDFMDRGKRGKLYQCIKEKKDEHEIQLWLRRFYDDLYFLVQKIIAVQEFNSYQVRSEDISALGDNLRKLTIDISDLEIFNNQKIKNLAEFVNQRIDAVLKETELLKRDIGQLKGLVGVAKKNAIADINDFLSTAGINYEFEIRDESDTSSKTMLRYVPKTGDPIDVENIRLHLSWGEKNAFALVLFMHYALSQNPKVIILDDPISSFDSNKKYAIINRLFAPGKTSFHGKTVLMLTHDLQPIIDCVVIDKRNQESVSACFLQNEGGVISEQEITAADIKSLPVLLAENAKNEKLNMIHRVASLRKLLENLPDDGAPKSLAYKLLSSLLHGETQPAYKDGRKLTGEEIKSGEDLIKRYIAGFDYTNYSKTVFTKNHLLKTFTEETNSYIRLQVFRVLLAVLNLRPQITDQPLLRYIDEQFHVENDYLFNLDFMKYDIVPDFVIPKCVEFLEKQHLVS